MWYLLSWHDLRRRSNAGDGLLNKPEITPPSHSNHCPDATSPTPPERQLLLRETPVRTEPGAQQRPEPLDGVDVHLAKSIPVLVAGVFAAPVADRFVLIAPALQAGVDAVLVGVDERAFGHCGLDDRLDRDLLHVGQHAQDHRATALDQTEDGRLVLLQRAPARCACQPPTASEPPLFATAAGWPLCPATT